MSRNEKQKRKMDLWTAAAMVAPLAHWSGAGYVAVSLAALAMIPLTLLPRDRSPGRAEGIVQCVWLIIVLSGLLPSSAAYWTGGGKTIPLTLLTLAAFAGGKEKAERAGNTIFWLLLPIFFLIILLSTKELEPQWLAPERGEWTGQLLTTLLLPSLGVSRNHEKRSAAAPAALIALVLAAVTQGSMGFGTAAAVTAPLYETGRAIGGGAEMIVSVGMTLSYYALCGMLFETACSGLKETPIPRKWKRGLIWLCAAALILFEVEIPAIVQVAGSLILWILLPILPEKNKLKKPEKRC